MGDWAEAGEASWLDDELAAQGLRDKRLASRLRRLLDRFSSAPGKPVPAACGDWAATKALFVGEGQSGDIFVGEGKTQITHDANLRAASIRTADFERFRTASEW